MTETDRIAEIRAREAAATPGPWHGPHDPDIDLCADVDSEQGEADAEFIDHAREDVPFLLDQLDQALAERDQLAARLHDSRSIEYSVLIDRDGHNTYVMGDVESRSVHNTPAAAERSAARMRDVWTRNTVVQRTVCHGEWTETQVSVDEST